MAKASDLASRMRGAAAAPVVAEAPPKATTHNTPGNSLSKYTVLLNDADNEILDNLARDGRRTTGRRTLGKSDVLRSLVRQLNDDPVLRQAVLDRLE